MKSNSIITITSLIIFSLFSCTIEGEQICGTWNSEGEFGKMKMEITPWEGEFYGYLLAYQNGEEQYTGDKSEEHMIMTDLIFEGEEYKNGVIYYDPSSEDKCKISFQFLDDNNLKALYDCDGYQTEEVWTREGFEKYALQITNSNKDDMEKTIEIKAAENPESNDSKKGAAKLIKKDLTNAKQKSDKKINTSTNQGDTQKMGTFYVIGVSQTVSYSDEKAISKAIENLWTKSYTEDFSSKLKNIVDYERMYGIYSHYDNPKGKMTLTVGYKVKDLSNVPAGLKGITILANDYYVYPLKGDDSDYEGEQWNKLYEMMAYRKADSVDFEIYKFDSNYEVTEGTMWIAAK